MTGLRRGRPVVPEPRKAKAHADRCGEKNTALVVLPRDCKRECWPWDAARAFRPGCKRLSVRRKETAHVRRGNGKDSDRGSDHFFAGASSHGGAISFESRFDSAGS